MCPNIPENASRSGEQFHFADLSKYRVRIILISSGETAECSNRQIDNYNLVTLKPSIRAAFKSQEYPQHLEGDLGTLN